MLVFLIETPELRHNCINDNCKAVAATALMHRMDALREALVLGNHKKNNHMTIHLENSKVLIHSDDNHSELLCFSWQTTNTHQNELIHYNNLLIELAKKHGYRYVLFNSQKLKNVEQDNIMDLFLWSIEWYKKLANAGVEKAAYVVNQRSQYGQDRGGVKVNDLLTIEEAYTWLLGRESGNIIDSKLQEFAILSKMPMEEQIVSLDFEPDMILTLWKNYINDFLNRGKTFQTLNMQLEDEEVTNLARSIQMLELSRKY